MPLWRLVNARFSGQESRGDVCAHALRKPPRFAAPDLADRGRTNQTPSPKGSCAARNGSELPKQPSGGASSESGRVVVLSEAHRVLKPGGRFLCLEFSRVENPLLRSVYDSYSFQVIPVMGLLLARDWKSYQYLVESIRKFPGQEIFKEMIEAAGFKEVTFENLLGGVAAIHSGFKL
ncbi:hypothetical protein HPB47_009578 [Ixodes persulcatus]|uniref:Uncharacterized protein n=1 Tax=Ixodes persulcatus TaxID=34615 RepID=A0AC60P1N8_IXOPE|nr:hypothetical protein HPB47_009578 [Ixodes persulcatus]